MKKVLIALDYHPTAQKIAEAGYLLAKAMAAEVTLIHIIADPVYYASTAYSPVMGFGGFLNLGLLPDDINRRLKETTLDFLDKTKNHLDDKTIKTEVREGNAAEAILDAANELQADIIVMGSHSRGWLEEMIMGNVTEKVLKHTSVPLYIIPTKERTK